MRTIQSSFKTNLSTALEDLLKDVDQIKNIIGNPKWKRRLSRTDDKNEVLLSRLVFDLSQANDHIMKTKEQISEIMAPEK